MKKSILYFSLVFLIIGAVSQNIIAQDYPFEENNPSKMKNRAKHALKRGDIYTAVFYYQELVRRDTNNMDLMFQLGELHRATKNSKEAEKCYANVYKKDPSGHAIVLYNLALMQKMNGRPAEAKSNFLEFRSKHKKLGDKYFKKHLLREIKGCDSAIVFTEFPERIKVENMGKEINQAHIDFSPFPIDSNTIIFGSLLSDTVEFYDTSFEHPEKQPGRQLYIARKKNTIWENEGLFEGLNDESLLMGKATYCAQTHNYYFTKCNKDKRGKVLCNIYKAHEKNGKIQPPELLPEIINMNGYTSTQPTVSYSHKKETIFK